MIYLSKKISLFIIITLLASLAACGYYNPYVARKDSKPISLHRSMWVNNTNELSLESTFYRSLSTWLRKTSTITLKDIPDEAQYVITGVIESVDYPELSFSTNREASELRARVKISFKVVKTTTGETVWQENNYNGVETVETFLMDSDPGQLQQNKKDALAKISDDVAEMIYLHIINRIMRPTTVSAP